jgi:hypothetical protein
MSETFDTYCDFEEPTESYVPPAEACEHVFSQTITYMNLLNKGQRMIRRGHDLVSRKEATEAEIRAFCELLKQIFLEGLSRIYAPPSGPLDSNFIQELIRLGHGDWTNPQVIQAIFDHYNKTFDSMCSPDQIADESHFQAASSRASFARVLNNPVLSVPNPLSGTDV